MMETAVNKKIDELNSTIFCAGMPNEVKAFIAHNYLAKTVTYWLDEEAKPLEKSYMQSAYGALINCKCVCQGYAEAYKRILVAQGIICEVICGKIKGSPDYHAWNVISFDKKNYYHVDVTWDARKCGKARYKYYGLSDADFQSDRIWTRMRAIYHDYVEVGDELWKRFNVKDKSKHDWYYNGIAERLCKEIKETCAFKEYVELLIAVFGFSQT